MHDYSYTAFFFAPKPEKPIIADSSGSNSAVSSSSSPLSFLLRSRFFSLRYSLYFSSCVCVCVCVGGGVGEQVCVKRVGVTLGKGC